MEWFAKQQGLGPDPILGPEARLHWVTGFLTFAETFELFYHYAICYVKDQSDYQQLNLLV